MAKLIIYGITPAAVQSHYDFTKDTHHEVVAFTVNGKEIKEKEFLGLPVVPFEEVESLYPPAEHQMFIAVYFNRVNSVRMKIFEQAKAKGYTLASYISSKAIIWPELVIGENCMICDGANVRPFTTIGNDTFIMPNAVVGHDAIVGEHCYLAIAAILLAGSKVESRCVIGANATILNGVTVAKECVISAGAVISANTKEKGVYTVNPPTLQPLGSNQLANVLFKVQV
jgi:sugar O-acyltransferase (sialic acid O-acetyltransferase NeuD family)